MLASPLGLAQQGPRVDFTIIGQVQGNVPRAAKQWMLGKLTQQTLCGLPLLRGGKRAACFA